MLPWELAATLDGLRSTAARVLLPAALALAAVFASIRRQWEEGQASHRSVPQLRDRRGRRLRATAYGRNPRGPRQPIRRDRSGGATPPSQPGSWLPAAVKLALVLLLAGGAFLGSSSAYINFAADLPDAHAIAAEPLPEDTLIFASDGTELADIHPSGLQHYYGALQDMGKWLPKATIAIEDQNFWNEPGIDPVAMGRAAFVDWRSHGAVQGASTITQQLVKLRLLDSRPTIDRKIKEAILAIQVEHSYKKPQILEMYLNTIPYGNNSQGAFAAARIFFHQEPGNLDLAQASMLAGIPQSPLYNSPFTNWTAAKARQKQVLNSMVRDHYITQAEADQAYAEDISPPNHMFKAGPQVFSAPGFTYWVIDQLKAKYGQKTAEGGGLRVTTTLDAKLQKIAETAIVNQVQDQKWRNVSQGALVSIDPHTGAIVAMVGAADTTQNGGQFNMAVWPPRNPGSSFKVFNYTAAIASGKYTMTSPIVDSALTVNLPPGSNPPTYKPLNYDKSYHGTCQLQQCMGNSLNVPAVKVELGVGVTAVAQMARNLGAPPWYCHCSAGDDKGWTNDDPLDFYGYSLTLGGYGETPLQMATGASVLGAQGVLHPPFAISKITGTDGSVIYQAAPDKDAKQVLDPRVAYIMEQIMSDDSNRAMIFGRGTALTLPGRTVGAKTGTTDNFTDAWTIGYTPDLATAVWMGNPNFSALVQGSDGVFVAAPAWHNYMQGALDTMGKGNVWFNEPPGLDHFNVGGKLQWYLPGTSPSTPTPPLPPFATSYTAPPPSPSPGPSNNSAPPPAPQPTPGGPPKKS